MLSVFRARRCLAACLLAFSGCDEGVGAVPAPCEAFDTGFQQEAGLFAGPLSAQPPELPATLITTSSYDRRSSSPAGEGWFANYDRGEYLGRDRFGHGVLVEHTGPGALVRLWSANPNGTLRIYIDDAPVPVIETPMQTFLSEANPLGAAFAYGVTVARPGEYGANFYAPIPFERSIRVTHEPAPDAHDLFWQASIKAYDVGVCVASFAPDAVSPATLEAAASALSSPGALPEASVTLDWSGASVTHTWSAGEGGAELRALCVASDTLDSEHSVVELTFDGVTTVRAPLRDFFGGLATDASSASFYTSYEASDFEWCTRFRMPFRDGAALRVTAPGAEPARELRVRYALAAAPFDDARYFHAHWRRTPDVVANLSDQRAADVDAGEGHFVGLVLALTNRSRCWWGEGDEKVWVDDEPFPRLFGTGTEDYFGYAWALPELFVAPFHGQPEADVGRGADTCGRSENLGGTWWNYRWHHLDPIDFQSSLRFDMEVWHWGGTSEGLAPLDMAFTGFWYGSVAQPAPALGSLATRPGVWPAASP